MRRLPWSSSPGAGSSRRTIAVLKRLYSYLRKVRHVLELDEDPTFLCLAVPQSRRTGWHVTELVPFVRDGATEAPLQQGQVGTTEVAGVVVCPQAKGGNILYQGCDCNLPCAAC